MHVLFVDDTPDTRELYRLYFTLNGHVTETAPDGLEALRIIARDSEGLDLIILDYHMPGMSGLEVVQHLRQMEDITSVPIILFTGDTQEDFAPKIRELGIACVVYKPIDPNKLIATAKNIVYKGEPLPVKSCR
ncbi:MAG: response regulator [Proteobacteria bacterium]|nr:MAG: response regulator [Pseudomonadota bacterium]